MSHHLSCGGDGSHWEGCHESHWDCRLAWLERALEEAEAGKRILRRQRKWQFDALRAVRAKNKQLRTALESVLTHHGEAAPYGCRQCEERIVAALGERADEGEAAPASVRTGFAE